MSYQILVVDDQLSFCQHIMAILESEGYEVAVAQDPYRAMRYLATQTFDVLLTDIKMPGMDGLTLFKQAKGVDPHIAGVIMTAYGSITSAVAAIKEGVFDYLQKPFEPEALLMVIQKTLREQQLRREINDLRQEVDRKFSFGNIIGKNHQMLQLYDLIQKVASTDARIFITGETGVGKELVAKAIHYNSHRKEKPFVGINCGALSESLLEAELFGFEKGAFTGAINKKIGKFEYAAGGTLFLDEIGEISPTMQVKLFRVLQEKSFERVGGNRPIPVDVRIISATNQNIAAKMERGDFRIELFYRLNVVPINIPPLRKRQEDIPLLVKHFIALYNKEAQKAIRAISPHALNQLMQHDWPGNVRELDNVLERACVTAAGDTIERVIFSQDVRGTGAGPIQPWNINIEIPFKVAQVGVTEAFEKAYIFEALKCHKGNVTQAAKETGINPRTLWRKINSYGLDPRLLKGA
jgi:DNA-binding NtrC family response regulator